MRIADYIFKKFADFGTEHVFMVSGGGAMFLNDALGLEKRIKYVCNLHEQACAIAAEGYARANEKPGVVCVTTGPGGTNALTGVLGAWLDSVPMIIISGQVKTSTTISSCPNLKLRQLGDQEFNIIDVVKPMTKYAKMITDVHDVKDTINKAWHICQSGRPGPVWIDVPLDIQSAEYIDEKQITNPLIEEKYIDSKIENVINILEKSKRPAVIVGQGIRTAKAADKFLKFVEKYDIPVLTSISGIDLIESNHRLFFGRPGIIGERAANFIMQNCDVFLVLGTRMGLRITGYAYDTVAQNAIKIMVDVDDAELNKPTFKPDIKIQYNVGDFIDLLLEKQINIPIHIDWLDYCNKIKKKYPVILQKHRDRKDYVSSYVFPEIVSTYCKSNDIIITGNGVAYTSTFQTFPIKKGMRMFANQGCASMGYGLPAAIGAAFNNDNRRVICITGDGSIQMNIQELQTILNYKLPIKLFIYNNAGYQSIKTTQTIYFEKRFVGSEENSGIILPSFEKLANAYGIKYTKIINNTDAYDKIKNIMITNDFEMIEVICDPFEILEPKACSKKLSDGSIISRPLNDMAPLLSEEEIKNNML